MKFTYFLVFLSLIGSISANECLKKKDDNGLYWARVNGRFQMGGWVFYTGKGLAKNVETATFKAEGMALSRMAQECGHIHKKTRIIERCETRVGDKTLVIVRTNLKERYCKETQNSDSKKIQNKRFTKVLNDYAKFKQKKIVGSKENKDAKLEELKNQLKKLHKTKQEKSKLYKDTKKRISGLKNASCESVNHCLELGKEQFELGKFNAASGFLKDGCFLYRDAEMCHFYGKLLKDNKLLTWQDSLKAFTLSCSLGYADGCTEVGLIEWLGPKKENYKLKVSKAKVSFKTACEMGSAKGCLQRGELSLREESEKGAYKYYWKTCKELKDPKYCFDSALSVSRTYSSKKEIMISRKEEAKKLFSFNCDQNNHLPSCYQHAYQHVFNWRNYLKNEPEKAMKLAEKACIRGNLDGCHLKGRILENYLKKPNEALKIYLKVCENPKGHCSSAGYSYLKLKAIDKAVHYYSIDCEAGNQNACASLAEIYIDHKKDKKKAFKLFKESCEFQTTSGCSGYGMLLASNKGEIKKGYEFVKYACKGKEDKLELPFKTTVISSTGTRPCTNRGIFEIKYLKKMTEGRKRLEDICKNHHPDTRKRACDFLQDLDS
jgi:TPR repeat protein